MSLWFLPLAKALAHEEPDAVSQDFLDLFRAYAELQRIIDTKERLTEITLQPEINCHRMFESSTGWKFTIFDDAGDWDYIEDVLTPDNQSLCSKFGWDYFHRHGTVYQPTEDDLVSVWQWDALD